VADVKPSSGAALDHVAISVADVDAKMKELSAAGARIIEAAHDVPGVYRTGTVQDPWGIAIEIVHDTDHLGFHSVHLRASEPVTTLRWYVEAFGGELGKFKGKIDGVRYGPMWLLATKGAATPSEGHAIDHVAWGTPNIRETVVHLESNKVTFISQSLTPAGSGPANAFMRGPDGARVHIVQR